MRSELVCQRWSTTSLAVWNHRNPPLLGLLAVVVATPNTDVAAADAAAARLEDDYGLLSLASQPDVEWRWTE